MNSTTPAAETSFCPSCGAENPASSERCTQCGTVLDARLRDAQAATDTQAIPFRPLPFAVYLGAAIALLAATSFVPGLKNHFFALKVEKRIRTRTITQADEIKALRQQAGHRPLRKGLNVLPSGKVVHYTFGKYRIVERVPVLLATGKMVTVGWTLLLFIVVGLIVGAWQRQRIGRELALAGLAVVLVQWGVWLLSVDGSAATLFTKPLHVESEGALIKLGPSLFLVTVSVLTVLAGVGGGRLGTLLGEQISGHSICPFCKRSYAIRPQRPATCPTCGASAPQGRVHWPVVAPAVAATLVVFFLTVRFVGPPLGFYYRCDFNDPSPECKQGLKTFAKAAKAQSSSVIVWRKIDPERAAAGKPDRGRGVVLHKWKYIGYLALLFVFAPFGVAWRARQRSLASAGFTLVLNWIGATLVAMIFLGFAQFEGVLMTAIRLHVLAAVPWCLCGALGALVGYRVFASKHMFEDIEP